MIEFRGTEGGEHDFFEIDLPLENIFTEYATINARLFRNNSNKLICNLFEERRTTSEKNECEVYKFTYYYENSNN